MESKQMQSPEAMEGGGSSKPSLLVKACSRRTFVVGGTAASLLSTLTGAARANQAAPVIGGKTAALTPAAVGYWNAEKNRVEAASGLMPEDMQRFTAGVQITVHGLGRDHADPEIASFDLNAHFPSAKSVEGQRFGAFHYRRDDINHHSSPVTFTMPVGKTDGLTLSLATCPDAGTPATGHVCRFSMTGGNLPKLREGVYFLALPTSHTPLKPDWDSFQFQPERSGDTLAGGTLMQSTLTGQRPVDFHYLVVTVRAAGV